ncbi:ATPase [Kitasatospora aureofaciens]|uniref:RapZ C-terminal domain-containing protein n=1 Tax=Kitasatospora aureofaciens TaxID=1894 RepID=UPI001C43BE94|nr:RNase adapter RapZ [Kitasatospora aureofaciens]MBV6700263.1 ATPase [Kitasatospora aureofaciens]
MTHTAEYEPDVQVESFGFLHGPVPEAHLVIDLRQHFKDPHVNPELRHKTARDFEVREAVLATPGINALLDSLAGAVEAFKAGPMGSVPLRVAIGCAGGRHRAATVAETLAARLSEVHHLVVTLNHRDIDQKVVERDQHGRHLGQPGRIVA